MSDRRREEARQDLIDALQRAISCVSSAVLSRGFGAPGLPDFLSFKEAYIGLRGQYRLELFVVHLYSLHQAGADRSAIQAETAGYYYHLRELAGAELIAFHWHPGRLGQPDYPHLHVTSQAGAIRLESKRHVPTEHVSLASVVRFAITELHVRPLRADWRRILEHAEDEIEDR